MKLVSCSALLCGFWMLWCIMYSHPEIWAIQEWRQPTLQIKWLVRHVHTNAGFRKRAILTDLDNSYASAQLKDAKEVATTSLIRTRTTGSRCHAGQEWGNNGEFYSKCCRNQISISHWQVPGWNLCVEDQDSDFQRWFFQTVGPVMDAARPWLLLSGSRWMWMQEKHSRLSWRRPWKILMCQSWPENGIKRDELTSWRIALCM